MAWRHSLCFFLKQVRMPYLPTKEWNEGTSCGFFWINENLLLPFHGSSEYGGHRRKCVKPVMMMALPDPKRDDAKILSNYYYPTTSLLQLICKKLCKKFILCVMNIFIVLALHKIIKMFESCKIKKHFSMLIVVKWCCIFSNHYRCIFYHAILSFLNIFNPSLIKSI